MIKTTAANQNPKAYRFVFGLEKGKPIGARFPVKEEKVSEIAHAKKLEIWNAWTKE